MPLNDCTTVWFTHVGAATNTGVTGYLNDVTIDDMKPI